MTLGQKLKEIRNRFGLSQEELANIMNVFRQAITKQENDNRIPDISNLQELSKIFGIAVDYLLGNESIPVLSMKVELDKDKYKNKLIIYDEVLKEYFDYPSEIYILSGTKKLNFIENIIDIFTITEIGPVSTADYLGDLSPHYLVIKNNIKVLVNIKNMFQEENNYTLKNGFRNYRKIKFSKNIEK